MAQHGPTGKHSAESKGTDAASQETKKIETKKETDSKAQNVSSAPTQKIDRAAKPDETKEIPKASKAAVNSTVKPISVDGNKKSAKQVNSGAADAEAAAKKKRNGIIAAAVIVVVIIAAVIGFMAMNSNKAADVSSNDMDVVDVESEPVDNPVDFAALQAQNPDVYAYMNIPNTNIDLPILFNAENDNYYLTHDIDGNSTIVGALYTQSMNNRDFTDPVTVVYGHTLLNGTMFSALHSFENPDFFAENPYFTVYLPNEMLTYEVVSAIEYSDEHIMNSHDFSNEQEVQKFFDSMLVADPNKTDQVREEAELKAGEDKILVLSTCTQPANDSRRFLVVGKLMTTQPTK